MFKRSLDIAIASVALIIVLPVLLLAMAIVKCDSVGPALFCQARVGVGFRSFKLYKLRTMISSLCGSPFTLGEDSRITRTGKWMRKFKIDELPQLWNVLRGDMSLVGPRPVIPALTKEFLPAYRRLLRERPGLTDPASLKYRRETEILEESLEPWHYFKAVVTPDKIRISEAYQLRANGWRDLGIMIMTVLMVLLPTSVYRARPSHRKDNLLIFVSREESRKRMQPAL